MKVEQKRNVVAAVVSTAAAYSEYALEAKALAAVSALANLLSYDDAALLSLAENRSAGE
jgi:hypothetical protein